MSMYSFLGTTNDLLFFRDARPMDVDERHKEHRNIGHGAYWPRPDHLYNAVMHALIGSRTAGDREFRQHGGLKITGPFPVRKIQDETLWRYFPRPLDWRMTLKPMPSKLTDIPEYLRFGFADCDSTKKDYPAWIRLEDYSAYLSETCPNEFLRDPKHLDPLFETEVRVGTTIDAKTRASKVVQGKRSGQYQAEYLRLGRDVALWCAIDTGSDRQVPSEVCIGGQGGMIRLDSVSCTNALEPLESIFPRPGKRAGTGPAFVRWTLLTPAFFSQTGWIPGWCKECRNSLGESESIVMLPDCKECKLVAACTGKPICFSGWDAQHGVKPTHLAVPAGSCYVFQCNSAEAADQLVQTLHLTRKSDLGSQGFGMGVCSYVTPPATDNT